MGLSSKSTWNWDIRREGLIWSSFSTECFKLAQWNQGLGITTLWDISLKKILTSLSIFNLNELMAAWRGFSQQHLWLQRKGGEATMRVQGYKERLLHNSGLCGDGCQLCFSSDVVWRGLAMCPGCHLPLLIPVPKLKCLPLTCDSITEWNRKSAAGDKEPVTDQGNIFTNTPTSTPLLRFILTVRGTSQREAQCKGWNRWRTLDRSSGTIPSVGLLP